MDRMRVRVFEFLFLLEMAGCQRPSGTTAGATGLTRRYRELLQAELIATDRRAALTAVMCEGRRLNYVLGSQRAAPLIEAADEQVYAKHPAAASLRDSLMSGSGYFATTDECTALARAGILGDTLFPAPGQLR